MSNKNLLFSLLFALILACAAYYFYNLSQRQNNSGNTYAPIEAKALYNEFSANKEAALAKYAEKPIRIKGVVSSRNKEGGAIVINLDTENVSDGVACELDPSFPHEKVDFEAGEEVIFNGICNGNIDNEVHISNCILDK